MAYREKVAWLTVVCMVIAYTLYFGFVATHAPMQRPLDILLPFGIITSVQAVVVIIGSIAIALQATKEARIPPDERDRAIARRGATVAYYVLMVGTIVVAVMMPFTEPPVKIVNTGLFALVIAEGVRHTLIILSYRRGWHG